MEPDVVSAPSSVWYQAERNTTCMRSIQVIKLILYFELILVIGYMACMMTSYIGSNNNNANIQYDKTLTSDERKIISKIIKYLLLMKDAIPREKETTDNLEENVSNVRIWGNIITSPDDVDNNEKSLKDEWEIIGSPAPFPELPDAIAELAKGKKFTPGILMEITDDPDQSSEKGSVEDPSDTPVEQDMTRAKRDVGESAESNSKSSSEETTRPASKVISPTEDSNLPSDVTSQ